jgi:2-methylcitrate dehydratase PrpD
MATNTKVIADHNPPAVTKILAEFIVNHPTFANGGWDAKVQHEGERTFFNWLGCAVGASHHEAPSAALAAAQILQPAPQATLLGRSERVDIANAALINGISSHTFDFDDTHLKTVIHPAGPVASALLPLAELKGLSGAAVIDALIIGIDVACRVGNCMYPTHYDKGWHITGSTGMLGAAAACARLLKLDVQQTMMALGIAASQPVGLREQFGTMSKPLHPGAAARTGLMAALMAQQGFTSSTKALEAPRGFIQVAAPQFNWNEITDELGKRFEISFNTYKPFACGIVSQPSMDACVQLKAMGVKADDIERLDLKVHSLVLELMGKKTPTIGLEGKFSVYHCCAVALIFGQAGEPEYSDAVVNRPDVLAMRAKVNAVVTDGIDEAGADVTAVLKDGRQIHVVIEHAIGSLERPMSDKDLEAKFHSQADEVLGATKAKALMDKAWRMTSLANVNELTRLAF